MVNQYIVSILRAVFTSVGWRSFLGVFALLIISASAFKSDVRHELCFREFGAVPLVDSSGLVGGGTLAAIKLWNVADSGRWYLVRTKQQKETLVQLKLAEFVRRTFLPRIRTRRLRHGNLIETVAPLFPCYLFALFDLESTLYRVLHTVGVAGVVCAGSTPSEVDASVIEEISRRGENGIIELPHKTFSAGERVRLTEGPMEGFAGIFEQYRSGSKRVALLLNLVGASMKVVVSATSIAAEVAD
jgi:transcriptional antiterminator RfaH